MSLLNLGLQCVALARTEMPEEIEVEIAKCNSLAELRKIAEKKPGIELAVKDSLSSVKVLLTQIFSRLKWNDKFVHMFNSSTSDDISEFWSAILSIDATLKEDGRYVQNNITNYPSVCEFISHCCQVEHYTFSILKCGTNACKICKLVRLPPHIFSLLKHLPHPVPKEDGHYLSFSEAFETITTGEHRPSLKQKRSKKDKSLPFYASLQHVKNSQIVVQCDSCDMWRIVFSKYKLKPSQRSLLQRLLLNYSYTCGSQLKDLDLPEEFRNVEIRVHNCQDTVEKLYYSAKYEPICVYCARNEPWTIPHQYPQCQECSSLPPIKK